MVPSDLDVCPSPQESHSTVEQEWALEKAPDAL
jgi:hypothetical protein